MTACRYYEAGFCKYGFRCRNNHTKTEDRERSRKMTKLTNKKDSNDVKKHEPVWIETRKWRVLSELDNLSNKFRFKVPSPTTREWDVWDSSDSEYEGDVSQLRRGKLNRLDSTTLSILICTNCKTQCLAGHSQEILVCESCCGNLIQIQSSKDDEVDVLNEDIDQNVDQIEKESNNINFVDTSDVTNVTESYDHIQCSRLALAESLPVKHLAKKEKKRVKKKMMKQEVDSKHERYQETFDNQNFDKENCNLKFLSNDINHKKGSSLIMKSKYKPSFISRVKKAKKKKKKEAYVLSLGQDRLDKMLVMILGDTYVQSASVRDFIIIMLVIITCFNIVFYIH